MATTTQTAVAVNRRKNAAAADVCAQFKKVLDGFKLYEHGHVTLKVFIEALHQKLLAFFKEFPEEELELGLTALSFTLDGATVLAAEKREDSITQPLFLDGIQKLILAPALSVEELAQLLEIWSVSFADDPASPQSFATRFWQANLQNVRAVAIETFVEGEGEGEAVPEPGKPAKGRSEDRVGAVLAELSRGRIGELASAYTARAKVQDVAREDLALLRMDALADLTAEDLAREDAAKRLQLGLLQPAEAHSLLAEFGRAPLADPARAAVAFLIASLDAQPAELERIRAVLLEIFRALVRANRWAELGALLKRLAETARADPARAQLRSERAWACVQPLGSPDIVQAGVAALDTAERGEAAAGVLRFTPPPATPQLLDLLGTLTTAEGRQRLVALLAARKPQEAMLADKIAAASPQLAMDLLALAAAISPAHHARVRNAALAHPDADVRRHAIKEIKREEAQALLEVLTPLLVDPQPDIRRQVLHFFLAAHDARAVRALDQLLKKELLDAAERKSVITALGNLGGPQAPLVLSREFQTRKEVDIRAACALALGACHAESARPLLKAQARKWFAPRALKDACKEALRRLDTSQPPAKPAEKKGAA